MLEVILIFLIILKLAGIITWSWWVVISPLLIYVLLSFAPILLLIASLEIRVLWTKFQTWKTIRKGEEANKRKNK